jgi:hypothetical protein
MTPEEEALTILERLRDGGLWQPAGLGLSYVRSGEKELKLTEQENNPTSAQARIRMRILIEKLGWRVDESEAQLIDVQHLSPQERHMQEMMMRQEAAQGWKCECGTPLSAFPLEEGVWTHDGQQEMRLPTGDVEMVEQWSVVISCPVCDKKIPTEPYDYALLAGDDAMVTYNTGKIIYTALSRPEIIERADKLRDKTLTWRFDKNKLLVLGTFCPYNGDLLPPHVRGAVVTFDVVSQETVGEEE